MIKSYVYTSWFPRMQYPYPSAVRHINYLKTITMAADTREISSSRGRPAASFRLGPAILSCLVMNPAKKLEKQFCIRYVIRS